MNMKPHLYFSGGRWNVRLSAWRSLDIAAWKWTERRACPTHGDAHGLSWCDICGGATR